MRNIPELIFQTSVETQLRKAQFTLWKWSIVVDRITGIRAFPDIVVGAMDDKKGSVAIECKLDGGLHCMTQAIGQCLVYKMHNLSPIICIPKGSDIPDDIATLCHELRIVIEYDTGIIDAVDKLLCDKFKAQSVEAAA